MASFRRALEQGAQMIECDLQLTADGHVVIIHDWTVDRTTDGTGIVCDLALDELRGLDAERLVDHVDEVHRDREGVRAHLEQRLEELAPTFEQHFDEVAVRLLDAPAEVAA